MSLHSAAVQLGSTRRVAPIAADAPWYKKLWHGWQKVARFIGNVLSWVVATSAYITVVVPFALGMRLFSDPLALKPQASHWTPLPPPPSSVDEARTGF